MQPLPQPKLGNITALTITTPDLNVSVAYYQQLGFAEITRADWPFPWVQITDGALLIMLRKDPKPYIALTYYVNNIDELAASLKKEGITYTQKPGKKDALKRYLFQSPDGFTISLVGITEGFRQPPGPDMLHMQPEDYYKPEKYTNKTCGMYGELAQPVADLNASIAFWDKLGFKPTATFANPYPWAILTDGLAVVGLHQTDHFTQPAITFYAADMAKKIALLKASGFAGIKDEGAGSAMLTTPEQQIILLHPLGSMPATEAPKPPQRTLETERLWLKEITPEYTDYVFTHCTDDEQMAQLGIATTEELVTEKSNWQKGLTTYRLSYRAFLMVEKATGKTIGKLGYHTWYLQHRRAEIGYALSDEAAKRKGYMGEAIKPVIAHGFEDMNLNRIEAFVSPQNEASLKLVGRFGFKEEGLIKQHYCKNDVIEDSLCFGLLRQDWVR